MSISFEISGGSWLDKVMIEVEAHIESYGDRHMTKEKRKEPLTFTQFMVRVGRWNTYNWHNT